MVKLLSRPTTANERLLQRAIRHGVLLEGLKRSEVLAILRMLDREVLPDLVRELQRRLPSLAGRGREVFVRQTSEVAAMEQGIRTIVERGMAKLRARSEQTADELATDEAAFQVRQLEALGGIEPVLPSPSLLREVVHARPFGGKVLRAWWSDLDSTTRKDVQQQVRIGLVEGETTDQVARRLLGTAAESFGDGTFAQVRARAAGVAKTAITAATTAARQASYEVNADILVGWQFTATLDSRTCPACQVLDGRVFAVGKGPTPPRHGGCRCVDTPVVKGAAALGLPPSSRASFNGQVADSLTYPAWLAQQDAETQDLALGSVARGRKFRAGDIAVESFEEDLVATLTPAQVRDLEQRT